MSLEKNKIYMVIDKNFDYYTDDVIKGQYFDRNEANKICDDLNLKHYIEIEAKTKTSDISSRYTVMTLADALTFIVDRVRIVG